MYDHLNYSNSAELCEQMANECDTAILAFSTGKDSIAAWLQLRKYFRRVVPFYKYFVPNLQFVEDSIKYYEDFFGCHIWRLPHPSLYKFLRDMVFQPPYRVNAAAGFAYVPPEDYNDEIISEMLRYRLKLPEEAYTATGVRQADNPVRRLTVKVNGAVNHNRMSFLPVYDWLKTDIIREIDTVGVKLPIDYRIFGRTFDGLHYSFQKPLRECFPEDYERFLQFFPLGDLEIVRWEGGDAIDKSLKDVHEYE